VPSVDTPRTIESRPRQAGSAPTDPAHPIATDRPHTGGRVEPRAEPASGPRRDPRGRKHVLVLEGHLCGAMALERRLGRREALRLLQDFLSVARDIAFKHEAYLHRIDESGLTL
jgi:hypothetical protein